MADKAKAFLKKQKPPGKAASESATQESMRQQVEDAFSRLRARNTPYIPNVGWIPEGTAVQPWNPTLRAIRSEYGDSALDAVLNFVAGDNGAVIQKDAEPLYTNNPDTLVIGGTELTRKQALDKLVARSDTNSPDKDEDLGQRRIAMRDVQDFDVINKLVRTYADSLGNTKAPEYLSTYGSDATKYNVSGSFMPEEPNRLNVQAASVRPLVQGGEGYPEAAKTLAHELTHAYQYQRNPAGSVPRKYSTQERLDQLLKLREEGRGSDSAFGKNHKGQSFLAYPKEVEATLIGDYIQSILEAKAEDDYRRERAPMIKPR